MIMTFNSRAKLPKLLKKRGLARERRTPTGERNRTVEQRKEDLIDRLSMEGSSREHSQLLRPALHGSA